ncbi:hypothetical protein BS329_15585 [Amycolatopsis coloradensis]|uniref:HTH gntR-type domain-containing protein n=2 Tax=Amycolatopsis coloradensis TaxID=76021 RepID=A0A1R0KUC2_9PSEU|nr:hypothetical protein BS329_15585 [Amycolatopsis coloradensis]
MRYGSTVPTVTRVIRDRIESGRYAHGSQLPSTRELADDFNVSGATITKAMQNLAADGLVVSKAKSSRIVHYPEGAAQTERGTTTVVVAIGGLAGTGKSEFGRILARLSGTAMVDKDTTTRAVVEASLEALGQLASDRESDTYLEVIRPAEYRALLMTLQENLECGISVVVSAPFTKELADRAWCDRLQALVTRLGGELHVVWVRCDPDTMRTYIQGRGAARDAYKLANWDAYLDGLDLDMRPEIEHTVIDNSAGAPPLEQQAAELLARIAR